MFWLNILNSLIIYIEMMILILISIAFYTLLERKILGYIQIRKGPNKVGFMGLLQPFSDAIKLFSKESFLVLKSNYLYYLVSPVFSMVLMLLIWSNLPYYVSLMNNELSMLMIFSILSMGVYSIMIAGWASNSLYSLIGGIRGIAQTISYEVSMILLILSQNFLIEGFNMYMFKEFQFYVWFLFLNFFNGVLLFISFLAELNRTPFDLAEGESELVSGFNTEYMSGSFALIFIAEYGMIMFMMMFFSFMFLGGNFMNLWFYLIYMFMLSLIIWIRGTFPRFRYDNLMYLTWKSYLSVSLFMLIFILSVKLLIV